MKSMRGLRVVVVIDSEHGHILAARLRRMEVAQVTAVAGLEEARLLCQSGNADACLVAVDAPVPDAVPAKESDTPGRWCGVPALMLAPVVTPHRTYVRPPVAAAISRRFLRQLHRGCFIAVLAQPFKAVTPCVGSRAGLHCPWPAI
jgi:predicted RNase H-like nuclease